MKVLYADEKGYFAATLVDIFDDYFPNEPKNIPMLLATLIATQVMSTHIYYKEHFVGNYKDITEFQKELPFIVLHYTQQLIPFLTTIDYMKYAGTYNSIFDYANIDPADKTEKSFDGKNKGMTEITPINNTISDISTPNTKSQFNAENNEKLSIITMDNKMRSLKFALDKDYNFSEICHRVYVNLIDEWNRIY